MQLLPHHDTPPLSVRAIDVRAWCDGNRLRLRYLVDGAQHLVLPDPAEPARADDLWKTTCFEAFVGGTAQAYQEFNFSPSRRWAAFAFNARREGMSNLDAEVEVTLEQGHNWIAVEAKVSADLVPNSPINLTAVIEERGGIKSYWALAHPDGPPDFHDPSCFLANLPE